MQEELLRRIEFEKSILKKLRKYLSVDLGFYRIVVKFNQTRMLYDAYLKSMETNPILHNAILHYHPDPFSMPLTIICEFANPENYFVAVNRVIDVKAFSWFKGDINDFIKSLALNTIFEKNSFMMENPEEPSDD